MAAGHGLRMEGCQSVFAGGAGELGGVGFVVEQTRHGGAEGLGLFGVAKEAGDAGGDEVGDAADVGGDDGDARGHAFEDDHGAVVFAGWQGDEAGGAVVFADAVASGKGDMFAPRPAREQLPEFFAVVGGVDIAEKDDFERTFLGEGIEGADEVVLVFAVADDADAEDERGGGGVGGGREVEEGGVGGVGDDPGAAREGLDRLPGVAGDANDAADAGEGEAFEAGGEPLEGKGAGLVDAGDEPHVAVDGEDVGVTGEGGGEGAVAFGALAVDEVGADGLELAADGADAADIGAAEPAGFGDDGGVEIDVGAELGGGGDGLLGAADEVDFALVREGGEAFEQGGGGGAEERAGFGVFAEFVPVIGDDDGDFEGSGHGGFSGGDCNFSAAGCQSKGAGRVLAADGPRSSRRGIKFF